MSREQGHEKIHLEETSQVRLGKKKKRERKSILSRENIISRGVGLDSINTERQLAWWGKIEREHREKRPER